MMSVPSLGVNRQPDQSDFNDMDAACGADATKVAIEEALSIAPLAVPTDATPAETDEQAIERLAALKPMQFDRVCKAEAKRMCVKASTLERLVKEARGEAESGQVAPFAEVEPWAEPVDGAALLADMARTIKRFIVCDDETVTATSLWCVAAWLVEHVSVCPILLINAPEKACGKTQLLTIVGRLVPRPAQAAGVSSSVLFRMVEKYRPTLLIDEIETVLTKEAEDLRGILNAGHSRDSAYVWRSVAVGDDFEPKRFSVFGFKALAGINADRLAETITSRAVIAQLRRKMPHETAERLRHAEAGLFDDLCAKLARWADDNAEAIRTARPALPDELSDRDQDNWEPLLAVADRSGGTWGVFARNAAIRLCGAGSDTAQSAGTDLLADIQEVFDTLKVQRIFSAELLDRLCDDEERSWATWNRGKPMTLKQLATRLSEYGVKSAQIRVGYESKKGYQRSQFDDAFGRYLLSSQPPEFSRNTETNPFEANAGGHHSVSLLPKHLPNTRGEHAGE